jgi:hypothetical protein
MDLAGTGRRNFVPSAPSTRRWFPLKTGTLSAYSPPCSVSSPPGPVEARRPPSATPLATGVGVGFFRSLDDVRNLTTGTPGKKAGDAVVEEKKVARHHHLEPEPEDLASFPSVLGAPAPRGSARRRRGGIQRLHESGLSPTPPARRARALIERASLSIPGRFPGIPVAPLVSGLFRDHARRACYRAPYSSLALPCFPLPDVVRLIGMRTGRFTPRHSGTIAQASAGRRYASARGLRSRFARVRVRKRDTHDPRELTTSSPPADGPRMLLLLRYLSR